MPRYETTREIRSHANGGFRLPARRPITPDAVPPQQWLALLAEGAVVEVGAVPAAAKPTPEPAPEVAANAPSLAGLNLDQLKAIADEQGVSYTWNIKAATLRKRLTDA